MSEHELEGNIGAVRFVYLHILRGGLCLRPPWSIVEHIGFDTLATNAGDTSTWGNPPLGSPPRLPELWPEVIEHPECVPLWQRACGGRLGEKNVRETQSTVRGFKEIVKLLTPPVLVKLARRIFPAQATPTEHVVVTDKVSNQFTEFEHVSEGWDYVKAHPEVRGWDVQDIVEIHRSRWEHFRRMAEGTGPLGISPESDLKTNADLGQHNTLMIFAYVIALASRNSSSFSLLDWGGGLGNYCLLAKSLLPDVKIDYHCKDLPGMAEIGATLLDGQHFYSNDSCLNRTYDLVLASGVLHYSKEWQEVMAKLAKATGKYLLVTRMPIVNQVPSYVFLQRAYPYGYNTEYLAWCINRSVFLEEARRLGLSLVREFVVGEYMSVRGAPEQCRFAGFLFGATH